MAEKTVQQQYNDVYGGHCDEGLVARIEARLRRELSDEDTAWITQWRTAKSYAEILKLNCAFLRGDQELNPIHMGPPYAETTPSIPTLIRLHEYGLLTIASQPSKTEEPEWAQCACCPKWSWFSCRQRAFLTFLLPQSGDLIQAEEWGKFLVQLLDDDRVHLAFFSGETGFHNFPEEWATHENKRADTMEGIEDAEAHYKQVFQFDDTDIIKHFATETNVMEAAKAAVVSVLAKSWDQEDLPAVVEEAAIGSGMKRTFAL
ncbi:hypothetical protein LTR17_015659 [Elasticomyces elasticus]|nr:hypothetical protein LTR17_015659 [Elasticomyces elasticus]